MNVKCYDSGEQQFDRYTVVFPPETYNHKKYWPYLGMSTYPTHPQGFGQHGELQHPPGKYLGKRIPFCALPEECQKLIKRLQNQTLTTA